jgi:hypothetical protein
MPSFSGLSSVLGALSPAVQRRIRSGSGRTISLDTLEAVKRGRRQQSAEGAGKARNEL